MKEYSDGEQKSIFSKNLRHYIDINDLQQKDFADKIGEKRTTVNNWCMGKTIPSVTKIQKIADFFGVVKTDLVDDHEFTEYQEKLQLEVLSLFNALEEKEQEIILTTMRALVTRKDS